MNVLTKTKKAKQDEEIVTIEMNIPQRSFFDLPNKFNAFVGGYGSGKTFIGCYKLARHFTNFPGISAGYFGATYPQIRDIFYPTVEEAFEHWGYQVKIKTGNHEVEVYDGPVYMGTIFCRSMDNPASIIGFKIGHAVVDEIDVLAQQKAMMAWRKIIARMRYKVPGLMNGIDVTTTPEGFGFVYNQFVKQLRAEKDPAKKAELVRLYAIVQASTYANEKNLPDDYVPSLLASYPPQLIDAYIEGQFVNLTTGTIYKDYNRRKNNCKDVITSEDTTLYIGMDFNIGKMAGIVHVLRKQKVKLVTKSGIIYFEDQMMPRAVDEIIDAYDTNDMIRIIKERYWKYDEKDGRYKRTKQIRIYPDASGGARSTNASETDLKLLQQAGFRVISNYQNPPVKEIGRAHV